MSQLLFDIPIPKIIKFGSYLWISECTTDVICTKSRFAMWQQMLEHSYICFQDGNDIIYIPNNAHTTHELVAYVRVPSYHDNYYFKWTK